MADSKLLVVPIILFVLLFCNRSDAVIGDVIDSEALDLKPNQEIEKLKLKIETLGFKYEIGDAIDSESLDLKPKQEIEMLKAKIETLGIKYEIDDAIDSEDLGLKQKQEIEKLKSKIEPLESITLERINELKRKNDQITHLGEGVVEDEEAVRKVHAHNEELQNQIAKLQSKLEIQRERREALEVRVCKAEKEVNKLIGKLEKVEKTNGEQRAKIHDIEHALQVAEKDLIGARQEARTKARELTKDLASTRWDRHGKPALDFCLQKVAEKSAQSRKWVEPHLKAAKTEAKKFSEPHIKKISTITGPHVARVQLTFEPYKKHVVFSFRKFLETASSYHHQVHKAIQENLKKHELTKPLATKMLGWYMDIALSASTLLCLYRIFSVNCRKRIRKTGQMSSLNRASRKHKGRHVDK